MNLNSTFDHWANKIGNRDSQKNTFEAVPSEHWNIGSFRTFRTLRTLRLTQETGKCSVVIDYGIAAKHFEHISDASCSLTLGFHLLFINQISLHGAQKGAKERHGKLILFCAKTCAGGGARVRSRNSCNSQAGWLQSSNDPYILTFTPQRKEQMQTHKLNHTDLHFKLLERIIIVSGFLGVSAVVPNLRISFPIINHGQSTVHPSPKQV